MSSIKSMALLCIGLFGVIPVVPAAQGPSTLGTLEYFNGLTVYDLSSLIPPQKCNQCGPRVAHIGAQLISTLKLTPASILKAIRSIPESVPPGGQGMEASELEDYIQEKYPETADRMSIFPLPINKFDLKSFLEMGPHSPLHDWLDRFCNLYTTKPRPLRKGELQIEPYCFIMMTPQEITPEKITMGHYVGCVVTLDNHYNPVYYYFDTYEGAQEQIPVESNGFTGEEAQMLNQQIEQQRQEELKKKERVKRKVISRLNSMIVSECPKPGTIFTRIWNWLVGKDSSAYRKKAPLFATVVAITTYVLTKIWGETST